MSKTCPRIQRLPEPTNLDELHKQIARFDDWFARDNKTPLAFRKFYVRMTMDRKVGVFFTLEYQPALANPACFEGYSLTAHIYDWYLKTYGHRRMFQVPLQHLVLKKRNTTWPLRVSSLGELWLENCHKHVDAAPTAKEFSTKHKMCWEGLIELRRLPGVPLVLAMAGDYDSSVYHLLGERVNLGLAQWHTMQATEKLLKVFLRAKGEPLAELKNLGHDLTACRVCCESYGLAFSGRARDLLKQIQCSPVIRYPEVMPDYNTELNLALARHYGFLTLAREIAPAIAESIRVSAHLGNVDDSASRAQIENFDLYRLLELEELKRVGTPEPLLGRVDA